MSKPCTDINASLALAKGWTYELKGISKHWIPPGVYKWNCESELDPPDFCGDSALTGELLEELWKQGRLRFDIIPPYTRKGKGFGEYVARAVEAMIEENQEYPRMNPFLDASPSDLKAMVPDLSDPELDAMCACVCDGEWVWLCDGSDWLYWGYEESMPVSGTIQRSHAYTSDGREAGRLLVKYRRSSEMGRMLHWYADISYPDRTPCRATTEAAVTVALAEAIEGDKKDPMA